MPHIPSRSSAVNDPPDLPLAVIGRTKPPALQFRCQTRENFVIRPALGLQYAVASADKLFRTLVQEREHFVDETHRLRMTEATRTNQISDKLVELGRLRHEPTVRNWRLNSKWFARIRAIFSVTGGRFRGAALVNEHRALERHHYRAVLVETAGLDRDDALAGPAVRLALREDFALGIERVAGENGRGRLDLVPAEIGDDFGADRSHAHAGQQRESEGAVDERLFPFGLGRILGVEMDLLNIHRQQCEPRIVGFQYGPARTVLEDVAGLEILVIKPRGFAEPSLADGSISGKHRVHRSPPFLGLAHVRRAALVPVSSLLIRPADAQSGRLVVSGADDLQR